MTTAPISQYLAMLGGSANPALMQQAGGKDGLSDFRNLLMMQSQGQGIVPDGHNKNAPAANAVWQVVRQQDGAAGQTETGYNSLVLHLTQKGLPMDAVDALVKAVDQSDMVTILRDPSLSAKLDAAIGGMNMDGAATMETDASSLIKIMQHLINARANGEDATISTAVADMSIDEFKDWKKMHFADMAAFFNRPKIKQGANGEIIKVLQGPAFLHDEENSGMEALLAAFIALVPPQRPVGPVEFALHHAGMAGAHQAMNIPPAFGTALIPNNLGVAPQTRFEAALAARAEAKAGISGVPTMTAQTAGGKNIAKTGAQAQAANSTALSPFMTPAEKSAFAFGGPSDAFSGNDFFLPFEAGFKTASVASNPVLNTPAAGQPHPATHMVSVSLTKMAAKGAEGDSQAYRLQLDPPEMGRIDIEMEFGSGKKIHAHLVVERPETLGLLQRDMHTLMKALQDAGFDGIGSESFSFDLSQGQNDPAGQNLGNGRENGQNAPSYGNGDGDLQIVETEMSLVIDPVTGQQRINMVV